MILGTLPLTNNPEENFNIVILDEVYSIKQLWNAVGFWTIDVFDTDGNILVYGIKIISGIFMTTQYPKIPWNLFIDDIVDPSRFTLNGTVVEVHDK